MNPEVQKYIERIKPSLEAWREARDRERALYRDYENAVKRASDKMRVEDPDNYLTNLALVAYEVVTGI